MEKKCDLLCSFSEIAFQRPVEFSNPKGEYSRKYLDELLSKKDSDLTGVDFGIIFNINLPCGLFEEVAYFLPLSLEYLTSNNDDRNEMVENWCHFIIMNSSQIIEFNEMSLNALNYLLEKLTCDFQIIHFNKEQCMDKGWGVNEYKFVQNSSIVCDLLNHLSHSLFKEKVVLPFISCLIATNSPVSINWLKEIVYGSNTIVVDCIPEEIVESVI